MRAGDVIANRFELQAIAGTGGMGVVFRAADRHAGGQVALKVLVANASADAARFEREAALLATLTHPGIVRHVAHGRTDAGDAYLAMEWLEGEDLAARLAREGLTAAQAVEAVSRVAEALSFAHAQGVVHRDIKPGNLFLVERDPARMKLLDFGIARLARMVGADGAPSMTAAGTVLGTPGYMAPEQARGDTGVDARSDVFSLGCVLFECLTGRPAFVGEHVMAILAKILLEEAPRVRALRAEVSEAIDELVARMLAKDPAARPRDARVLAAELALLSVPPSGQRAAPTGKSDRPRSISGGEQRIVSVVLARQVSVAASPFAATLPVPRGFPMDAPRAVCARFGARIDPLADGSLVVTLDGGGNATDRAVHAARLALALRGVLPEAVLMLATGRAVVASHTPVGEVIERAAGRIGRAGVTAGTVLVDDVTAGLLDARFEVEGDGDTLSLRGAREPSETPRTLLGRATPCVGRDRDLANLTSLFEECVREPVARTSLVIAPSGMGKSRLRDELLRRLRDGGHHFELIHGRGEAIQAGAPFGLVAPALRRSAGILDGEPLAAAQTKLEARVARSVAAKEVTRVTLFLGELVGLDLPGEHHPELRAARVDPILLNDQTRRAWEDFVLAECAVQPLLMVFDDMQWGDLPSLKLINAALRVCAERPLFVLGLARPEMYDTFPKLFRDRPFQELHLAPIPPGPARELVRAVLGDGIDEAGANRVIALADGHPLFLEELLRAAAAGEQKLPETVLAIVQARLESMEPAARRVMRAASVFGETFWGAGVSALVGSGTGSDAAQWLATLAEREVVVRRHEARFSDTEEYAFRHATLREAAYAMLTEGDRVTGHRLAASWLESSGEREAIVLAEHFDRGAESERAMHWYQRAAEEALDANDFVAAAARAERAIECGASGPDRGAMRRLQAEAHRWRAAFSETLAPSREAVALLPRASSAWCAAASELLSSLGHSHPEELASFSEEIAAVEPDSDARSVYARAICRGAVMSSYQGEHARAARLLQRAEMFATGEVANEPAVAGWLSRARSIRALMEGDLGAASEYVAATLHHYERQGNERNALASRVDLGDLYKELGMYQEATGVLREALSLGVRLGLGHSIAAAAMNLCFVLTRVGLVDEAEVMGQRAFDMLIHQGDGRLLAGALIYLAAARLAAGDLDAAEQTGRNAVQKLDSDHPMRCGALAVLAQVRLARGDTSGAKIIAVEARDLMGKLGQIDEGEALVGLTLCRAQLACGDTGDANATIAGARDRLLTRAAKILDPKWRKSFLESVPEHGEILALARRAASFTGA